MWWEIYTYTRTIFDIESAETVSYSTLGFCNISVLHIHTDYRNRCLLPSHFPPFSTSIFFITVWFTIVVWEFGRHWGNHDKNDTNQTTIVSILSPSIRFESISTVFLFFFFLIHLFMIFSWHTIALIPQRFSLLFSFAFLRAQLKHYFRNEWLRISFYNYRRSLNRWDYDFVPSTFLPS